MVIIGFGGSSSIVTVFTLLVFLGLCTLSRIEFRGSDREERAVPLRAEWLALRELAEAGLDSFNSLLRALLGARADE